MDNFVSLKLHVYSALLDYKIGSLVFEKKNSSDCFVFALKIDQSNWGLFVWFKIGIDYDKLFFQVHSK